MTSDSIKIKKLKLFLSNFNTKYFNIQNEEKKKDLILNLINAMCKQCNVNTITMENLLFVDKQQIDNSSSQYDPLKIQLKFSNEILIKTPVDEIDIYSFLNNLFHETIHYIQHKQEKYLETLLNPLQSYPYYIFQQHEQDAYNSAIDLLEKSKIFFKDNIINAIINLIKNNKYNLENNSNKDLINRSYLNDYSSVQKQISQILPFYKDYHKFLELKENKNIEKSIISNKNTQITIIKDNDSWHCDIAINKKDEINHLYCCINDICKISEIHKNTNDDDLPVSLSEKEELMIILNKIIDIYNERHIDKCSKIEIMPISLFDNRKDYEQFLQQKHQITKPIEDPNSSLIPLDEIKRQCLFDTLEEQIKSNTSKEEAKEMNQPNKNDLNR